MKIRVYSITVLAVMGIGVALLRCATPKNDITISDVIIKPDTIHARDTVTFLCEAHDESGDPWFCVWSATKGTLSNKNLNPATWIAPDTSGVVGVSFEVGDNHGNTRCDSRMLGVLKKSDSLLLIWEGMPQASVAFYPNLWREYALGDDSIRSGYVLDGEFSIDEGPYGNDSMTLMVMTEKSFTNWRWNIEPHPAILVKQSFDEEIDRFSVTIQNADKYVIVLFNGSTVLVDGTMYLRVTATSQ
jgi:hypothetical protein